MAFGIFEVCERSVEQTSVNGFVVAMIVAFTSTVGGLIVSYYADLASGATIVTLAGLIFFIAFVWGQVRNRIKIRGQKGI